MGFPERAQHGLLFVLDSEGMTRIKLGARTKNTDGLGVTMEILEQKPVRWRRNERDRGLAIITPEQSQRWEKENDNRFVTQRSAFTGAAGIVLSPSRRHTNIPPKQSNTHMRRSFKGSLLGPSVSLGRVEGFVCGQDVASTSH